MSIIRDLYHELLGMFVADGRLALATLFLVAVVAALVDVVRVGPFVAGGILLFGCLAILVEAASREASGRGPR